MTKENLEEILKDRSSRIEELINLGRFEDAISIGEEFDEWIKHLMI